MANRTVSIMLTALLPLTACSHWERAPGNTAGVWDEDKARCYLVGRGMPKQGFAFAGGGSGRAGAYAAAGAGIASAGMIIAQAVQEQEDRDACMTISGWRKVAGPAPRP